MSKMPWASEYVFEYTIMPTTIHIPGPLLAEVDKRAKRLKLSRNRFISARRND
jgi:hypothetical protein